jgi:hypothetical protein
MKRKLLCPHAITGDEKAKRNEGLLSEEIEAYGVENHRFNDIGITEILFRAK